MELDLPRRVELNNNKNRLQPARGLMHNNNRKIHGVLVGTLAVLVPCFAAASPPSDAAVGQVDAILDFCVRTAPRLSAGAHTYRVLFSGSGSSGSRSAPAYHEAYQQVSAALAKGNIAQEAAACAVGLEVKGHDPSHRDGDRKRDDEHKKDH